MLTLALILGFSATAIALLLFLQLRKLQEEHVALTRQHETLTRLYDMLQRRRHFESACLEEEKRHVLQELEAARERLLAEIALLEAKCDQKESEYQNKRREGAIRIYGE